MKKCSTEWVSEDNTNKLGLLKGFAYFVICIVSILLFHCHVQQCACPPIHRF